MRQQLHVHGTASSPLGWDIDCPQVLFEGEAKEPKFSFSGLFDHTSDSQPHRCANMHRNPWLQCHLLLGSVFRWSRGHSQRITDFFFFFEIWLQIGIDLPSTEALGSLGTGSRSPCSVRGKASWDSLGIGAWILWVSVLFHSEALPFLSKLLSYHSMRAALRTNVSSFYYLPFSVRLSSSTSSSEAVLTFCHIKWNSSSSFYCLLDSEYTNGKSLVNNWLNPMVTFKASFLLSWIPSRCVV